MLSVCVALLRKKNQFKNENLNLKKENEDLIEQIRMLEEKLTQHQVSLCFEFR